MENKIGRNSLCPCGSSLKYKKCCLGKSIINFNSESKETKELKDSSFHRFIRDHDSGIPLKLLIGAQLLPDNQGKEIRLELITKEIVKNLRVGEIANANEFIKIVDNEWESHYLEDPPSGLFAENVLFYGGNYTVLPGIAVDSGSVFTYFSYAIFYMKNSLTEKTKTRIYSGCSLLLELVNYLLKKSEIQGNTIGTPNQNQIIFGQEAVTFSEALLVSFMTYRNIDPTTLEEFIVNPEDPGFDSDEPDDNPLIYKPLLFFQDQYYYTLPVDQLMSINNFIKEIIIDNQNEKELIHNVTSLIWDDILKVCQIMGWFITDIPIPSLQNDMHAREAVFQFDRNHLAYVMLISSPILISNKHSDRNENQFALGPLYTQMVQTRNQQIIEQLKSNTDLTGYSFLSVILLNSNGQEFMIGIGNPAKNEERIFFSVFDFIDLGKGNEWDKLGLWKFAKAYRRLTEETELTPCSMLDVYGLFKSRDYSFYFSDEKRPNVMFVAPGSGHEMIVASKMKRDYHGVIKRMDGVMGYIPVIKHKDYAPIYRPLQPFASYSLFLGTYSFPFWIINNQCTSQVNENIIDSYLYAIAFWLTKLSQEINEHLLGVKNTYVELLIELDKRYFEPFAYEEISDIPKTIETSFSDDVLNILIPIEIYRILYSKDNAGERYIIKEILLALNNAHNLNFQDDFIDRILNKHIPLGPAKMILSLSTKKDIRLDPRWLYPVLLISEAEINMFLDDLPRIIGEKSGNTYEIENTKDKILFCRRIVKELLNYLIDKLSEVNHDDTLTILLQLNESLIRKREFNKLQVPAQIHCFGNITDKLKEFEKEEVKIVNTALSIRCLIELIANKSFEGSIKPSYDQVEELLVIMSEIINIGILSDSIYFEFTNPKIGLLPSGRIGISKEFQEDILSNFKAETIYSNIEYALQNTSGNLDPNDKVLKSDKLRIDIEQIDKAFFNDLGISFSNLYSLVVRLIIIAEERSNSVVEISEDDLLLILTKKTSVPIDEITNGLNLLSMPNKAIITSDTGYTNKEFYPWRYNRKYSLSRRPFIIKENQGNKYYKWGMRQVYDSFQNISDLFFEGRFRESGREIESLSGSIEEINGKYFRDTVKDWLISNSNFQVWNYEIKISSRGHLFSEIDLGDIDILLWDKNKTVFCLECKKTVQPRIIHEMKTEMDNYLGKDGKTGKINKHLNRDTWLKSNIEILKKFINTENEVEIKSIIVTSEVLPLPYLRNKKLPLPFINFPELRRKGITHLYVRDPL